MSTRSVSVGIDIGSTKIAVTIGHMQDGGIDIVGIGYAPSQGLRKGSVIDIEDTVSSIASALDEAERMSGLPVSQAVVNIGGVHIQTTSSKGVVAVARPGSEISDEDILRVLDSAKSVSVPPNRDIIHAIARAYSIDGQEGIRDPRDMSGIRLEVDTQVISGATGSIKNLTKCLTQANVGISEMVFTPLAAAKSILTKRQKEIGVALVDIGASTTSYAVYEEGDLLHAGVLPVGAAYITNDIAIGLRTDIDTAEILKVKYGSAVPAHISPEEELPLSKIIKGEEGTVNLHYISEIIEARFTEILVMVRDELRAIGRDGLLPAGLVLTGGGSKQRGCIELAKQVLKLPVHAGAVTQELSGMVDNVGDPLYASSIGLMLWGLETQPDLQNRRSGPNFRIGTSLGKVKGVFKHFLPN